MEKAMTFEHNTAPLISVIIPVYNSSKYISKCLNSVIRQSFRDIEIICVDDASKDKSLSIIKKYSSLDERIKVFSNDTNMGAGYTRNIGTANAKGKYIYFLDSDDWLVKDGLMKLAKTIEKYGEIDIISFLHYSVNATTHIKTPPVKIPDFLSNKVLNIFTVPECIHYFGVGMTKLIKKSLLEEFNIKFNGDKCFEDEEHFLDLAPKAKSIVFINEIIFCYRVLRRGSVVSQKDAFVIKYLIKDTCKADEISKNFPPKVRNELLKKTYRTLAYTALDIYSHFNLSHSELKDIFKNYIKYEILEENNLEYYMDMYNKVMNSNKTLFMLENFVKMRTKELFPNYFKLYLFLKARFFRKTTI